MTPIERAMIRYVAGLTLEDAREGICTRDVLTRALWKRGIDRRNQGTPGRVPSVADLTEAVTRVMGDKA